MLANPDKRPFILSRSNFLGGHRYAATWTGDNLSSWEQLKLSVPMTLTLGLSAQPFNGPDIGGFCESANGELLASWTAMGVFFPFVRNHSIKGSVDQEPWAFDEVVLDACRTAIERRYLLMPYIYTAFREASTTGMPVMRPVFMADAKDTSLRSEDKAFLLGGDLMVVPNWAGQVAMPKGEWCKLDLSSMNTKVQKNDIRAQLLQRPGFGTITLMVCLDADRQAVGTLYEDAGDGFGYRTGDYRLSRIEAMVEKNHLLVSISKVEGAMDEPERMLRVGYLKKGKLQFTPWQKGPKVVVRMR